MVVGMVKSQKLLLSVFAALTLTSLVACKVYINESANPVITSSGPSATSQTISVSYNTATASFALSGTAADGKTLTYEIVDLPDNGILDVSALPNVIYTPASGYIGSDSFTFRVNDGEVDSSIATVRLPMSILYFYNDGSQPDAAWDTVENWWKDASYTIPAGRIPHDGDFVYLRGSNALVGDPADPVELQGFDSSGLNSWFSLVDQDGITEVNSTSISIGSHGKLVVGIPGDVAYVGNQDWYGNTADATVDVVFQGCGGNRGGLIKGNAKFYDIAQNSYTDGSGGIHSIGTIEGTATFYDSTFNTGVVQGNAIFNDNSTFNSGSTWPTPTTGYIAGNVIFNDTSSNAGGTIGGTCTGNNGSLGGPGC